MKRSRRLTFFAGILCLAIAPAYAQIEFSLKAIGGYSFIDAGDINDAITGFQQQYGDYGRLDGTDARFSLDEIRGVMDFRAELLMRWTPHLAVGFGIEALSRSSRGSGVINSDVVTEYWWGTDNETMAYESETSFQLSSVPIMVNLYYYFPVGRRASFYLQAGMGYYCARIKYTDDYISDTSIRGESWYYLNDLYEFSYTGSIQETSKAYAFGFQGGLGLDFPLSPSLCLLAELNYRGVRFQNWKGDYSDRWEWEEFYQEEGLEAQTASGSEEEMESGSLWFYSYEDAVTGGRYSGLGVFADKPASDSRRAVINLNGFSIRLGIRIRI